MCDQCGPEIIHHVAGERSVYREHCFCKCHDRLEGEHMISGAQRDDPVAAVAACAKCTWAHAVAMSTKEWRNDERNMTGPVKCPVVTPVARADGRPKGRVE